MTYSGWLDEVRRLFAVLKPGFLIQSLDPNLCFSAWQSGVTPNDFVQNSVQNSQKPGPQSSGPKAIPPSRLQNGSTSATKVTVTALMWTLTAMVMLCGTFASVLYARGMFESESAVGYVALALDVPACILAFVCLARKETIIQGIAKLAWEAAVGISVYFLVLGIAHDRELVYRSGYSEGGSNGLSQGYKEGAATGFSGGADAGYQDGYHNGFADGSNSAYSNGFNDGANQQLSHDRAAVGGFGY